MKFTLTIFASLIFIVQSCNMIYDPYCCDDTTKYANDCFVKEANISFTRCCRGECPIPGGIKCLRSNSTEWQTVEEYVNMLDQQINAKLIDAGVKYNYGCWNHFTMSEAKMQVVNGNNYWVKLELLCEPLAEHNYAHVYFYVPNNMDAEGHVEFPHPELKAMQYPRSSICSLDGFSEDDIVVNATIY